MENLIVTEIIIASPFDQGEELCVLNANALAVTQKIFDDGSLQVDHHEVNSEYMEKCREIKKSIIIPDPYGMWTNLKYK